MFEKKRSSTQSSSVSSSSSSFNRKNNNNNNIDIQKQQQKQKRSSSSKQKQKQQQQKQQSFSIIKLVIIGLVLGLIYILIITTDSFLFLGDNSAVTVTTTKTTTKTETIGQEQQHETTTTTTTQESTTTTTHDDDDDDDVNDNNDNDDNDDNDDNNDNDDFHKNIWPLLQSHLCPKPLQPNKDLATLVLFPLAAQQVFLSSSDNENSNKNKNKNNNNNTNIIIDNEKNNIEMMMMIPKPTTTKTKTKTKKYGGSLVGIRKFAMKFYSGFFAKNVLVYDQIHKSTITYIPIWKCANNQIRYYLQSTYKEIDYNTDLTNLINNNTIIMDDSSDTTTTTTSNSKSCVITVIRDPIIHFLSGYNEIEYRMIFGEDDDDDEKTTTTENLINNNNNNYNNIEKTKFKTTTTSTNNNNNNNNTKNNKWMLYGKPQLHLKQKLGSTKRFEYFVKEILGTNSSKLTHYYISHIFSMSRILMESSTTTHHPNTNTKQQQQQQQQILTAYLPTISNLTYNFPSFINRNCGTTKTGSSSKTKTTTTSSSPNRPMKVMGQHNSSKDILGTYRAAKQVWNLHGPTAKALCIIHVIDYACWTKLKIPKFCKDHVYNQYHFIQTITNTTYYYRKQLEEELRSPNPNNQNRQFTIQGKKWPLPIPPVSQQQP